MYSNSHLSSEMLKKSKPQLLHILQISFSLQMDHGFLPGPCLLLLWEGENYLAKAYGEICWTENAAVIHINPKSSRELLVS